MLCIIKNQDQSLYLNQAPLPISNERTRGSYFLDDGNETNERTVGGVQISPGIGQEQGKNKPQLHNQLQLSRSCVNATAKKKVLRNMRIKQFAK